jgi:GNAT superfamily N-acetyltransferase
MENVPVQNPARATIRARTESDADPLVGVLAEVHLSDAYPMMATHVSREWLFDPGFEAAWVAAIDGVPIGHIAVKRGYGGAAIERASGRPATETLGVTRFFVGKSARGTGAASALLDAVDDFASEMGLALALDVVEFNTAAIALYERRGWKRVGSEVAQWFAPDGPHPTVHLYIGPHS